MNINDLLLTKMQQEVNSYREWLLKQTPEEILKHSWEYVSKQDIVMSLEENNLEDDLATALYNSENPLTECFENYGKMETSYMDDIFESVKESGKKLKEISLEKERKEKQMKLKKENEYINCADKISSALDESYDINRHSANTLKALDAVLMDYDFECVRDVTAISLINHKHDGRIHRSNIEWAEQYEELSDFKYIDIKCHAGILDMFADNVIEEEYLRDSGKDRQDIDFKPKNSIKNSGFKKKERANEKAQERSNEPEM